MLYSTTRKTRLPLLAVAAWLFSALSPAHAQTVYVSRMWHNHQPVYWPDWNGNGSQTSRMQYAWDSIVNRGNQTYGTGSAHPSDDLTAIFSVADRVASYQVRPRDSLASIPNEAGFCMSYTGSLIDNVRSLGGANQLGYGSGWWDGNRQARTWLTPSGSRRMELVGFTYHHALAPLLPKSVFRKELDLFKQAYWKAWGGNSDLSDHSKGYFPTEMAFSSTMIDVLSDEGYQWAIVASHHLSRTCPTYNTKANPTGTYNIKSSPPNPADQLGPSPADGWWFNEPNPGQATWNVSPYAYQLQRVKYVNPETGAEKSLIVVPSDDTLSYMAGYSGAQVGIINTYIAPFSTDSSRPAVVLPATDGDNAWGGGYDSWMVSTPNFFNSCKSAGYQVTAIQDLINSKPPPAGSYVRIEDGAWIFPESDYGSPYFLKWIEPPVMTTTATNTYPGTIVDLETPGFTTKFLNWASIMAGANWCETAEQIFTDPTRPNPSSERRTVEAWRIQAPYDWDGTWTSPNDPELGWHIYLGGLDSGFNYYGGLGNDDEVKPTLATRRAVEKLQGFVYSNLAYDKTPPTVLKPQRFPWNPGAYTFGWFNSIPGGNTAYLKKMPSEFYIWTHAYDVSGVRNVNLKVRIDNNGANRMSNNQSETYAEGPAVGSWITIPMTKRTLPQTRTDLNAAANNSQIDYFITPAALADYYFAKITDAVVPSFRGKLLDYYIEADDTPGNLGKSDIQHVFVADDGAQPSPPAAPTGLAATGTSDTGISLSWNSSAGATLYLILRSGTQIGTSATTSYSDTGLAPSTFYSYTVIAQNAGGNSAASDSAGATTLPPPAIPVTPANLNASGASPTQINLSWDTVSGASGYLVKRNGVQIATTTAANYCDTGLGASTTCSYTIAAVNSAGTSADSSSVSGSTPGVAVNFVMDGVADSGGYLLTTPGATMTLYAAVRGSKLYVATWSPGSNGAGANDHFILVTDQLLASATQPAIPTWSKSGFMAVASTKPFLGGESTNTYAGWANAGPSAVCSKSATNSGQMEGTLDLIEAFGTIPQTIYIAAVAYATADSGALAAQAPAGNGDGNLDPGEFLAISVPAFSLLDRNGSGKFDRLDPAQDFKTRVQFDTNGMPVISWPSVPGKNYRIQYCDSLDATWTNFTGGQLNAAPGQLNFSVQDSSALPSTSRRFYRVELLNP
jgi:hypothetical protein